MLKNGYSPSMVYAVSAVLFVWKNIINMFFARKYTGISIILILKKVYLNVMLGGTVMFVIPYWVSTIVFNTDWHEFIVVCVVSVIISFMVIYCWGLSKGMRQILISKFIKH